MKKRKVRSSIVLCGGISSRMGDLTLNIPKALLKIQSKPIIWYTIGFLIKNGINRFIFPLGYLGQMIEKFLSDIYSDLNIELIFCDTGQNTAIHSRIEQVSNYLDENESFVLINSDTLFKFDLLSMIELHNKKENDITLSSVPVESPWGIITTNNKDEIIGFERNLKVKNLGLIGDVNLVGEVYSGLCLIRNSCLLDFDWKNCFDFETDLFNKYIKKGKVDQFQINGVWYPIDTPKHLSAVNNKLTDLLGKKGFNYYEVKDD